MNRRSGHADIPIIVMDADDVLIRRMFAASREESDPGLRALLIEGASRLCAVAFERDRLRKALAS